MTATIPGYTFATGQVACSPVTLTELDRLQQSLLFGEADVAALRASFDIVKDQVEAILDVWYGFVASTPHLVATFVSPTTGEADGAYLAAVRKRFAQWILDTARAEYDQAWLDYQHEIALRHHRTKKNQTDGADGSAIVPFAHLVALVVPVTTTLKPFLAAKGHAPEEVERIHAAWVKSVLLQAILWSHPYVRDGDF